MLANDWGKVCEGFVTDKIPAIRSFDALIHQVT